MNTHFDDIRSKLSDLNPPLPEDMIRDYLAELEKARSAFPLTGQTALLVRLLAQWESERDRKIVASTCRECPGEGRECFHLFGILSADWPGLSNACLGVVHDMGWNVDHITAFNLNRGNENLGVVLIGIRVREEDRQPDMAGRSEMLLTRLRQAAVGTGAKVSLLSEEMRKLEIYSQVIASIEPQVEPQDWEAVLGPNGEAVKYFAARSRDYIENRKVEDIGRQILLNFGFLKAVRESADSIQLDITNIETRTEGVFTSVTVAGPAKWLNLEDCLKTIALTIPRFFLKHNREFTTNEGTSLFRIEFTDSTGQPLREADREKLRKAFTTLVLSKRQSHSQWIESIGGFEHYARAIIPLLVREAQSTGRAQVYQSVGQTTDLFIDFKIIVVVPDSREPRRKLVTRTVEGLEGVPGLEIFGVKPPKTYEHAEVFILDLRASLTVLENAETIYRTIKENVAKTLGEFRDFDEGMRTLDTEKFKSVRRMLDGVDKSLIREMYYAIEDFFRVGASIDEIVAHIRLMVDMLAAIDRADRGIAVLTRQTGQTLPDGSVLPRASLICAAVPQPRNLLRDILEILENEDVTLSRLERPSWTLLLCRITRNDQALPESELADLAERIRALGAAKPAH
ncbi:hypothetical protein JW777_03860 [bacterium]|nr:hypothetical protein [bacterium]